MARVLIVDDNPQIREVLEECVRQAGHDVAVADNGKSALEYLSANPVDVMILDIIMPEKDGLEVILELLGRQNRCRVIAISGGAAGINQGYILQMSKKLNVDAVLSKPFDFEVLNATLAEVLSR
jgi:CheY-like chemotaxis protein